MKIKHLRRVLGVLLAGVLALTPAGSAFVPVYGAEAEESVSENTVETDESKSEDSETVNLEKTEDAAGYASENEADTEAEEAGKSTVSSAFENENAPVKQKDDIEKNAGDVTYEEAKWRDYDCILDRANKRLTLKKYTGASVNSLTVPAKATGITLKQGGTFNEMCTVCIGRPLDYYEYYNSTDSIWNGIKDGLEELTLNSGVECNQDLGHVFYGLEKLTSISLNGLDTSNVTDMGYMFCSCKSLKNLDVSGFNTENVTYMNGMFLKCSSLETLDVRGFNTSKVRYMVDVFRDCEALSTLDVSGFDTSNAEFMSKMFMGCSELTRLDVSGFDTSKVTEMYGMFWGCKKLTSLNVSNFDTSNVTEMDSMFCSCSELTSLAVSGFNTSNVTNMGGMFSSCSKLTTLDVSGFDTSNVTEMYGMFLGCKNLTSLNVSNFDTSNVTAMDGMFCSCLELTSLDVSGFNTSNVTNMGGMFSSCSKLTSLDVSGFDTSNVTDMKDMFFCCSELTSLDVSGFDTSNVTDMSDMFYCCSSLTALSVNGFDTSKVRDMSSMFEECSALTTLDLSGFDTSGVYSFNSMIYGCSELKNIVGDLSNFSGDSVGLDEDYEYPTDYMIAYCNKLKKADLSGFSSFAGNELNSDNYLEEVVFPDKLSTVSLGEYLPLQGTFYFPETLNSIKFEGSVGDKNLTVYGPSAIKASVEALDKTKTGNGTVTFIEMNSSSQNYPYTEKIYAEGISLDITEHTLKFNIDQGKGGSVTITAQITPSSVSNQKVRWSSDSSHVVVKYNPSEKKARVTATGLDGDARITATSGDGKVSAKCLIHVKETTEEIPEEVSVTGVTLDPKVAKVAVNNTIKLKASVKPDNATNKKVTWSSSDNSIATVDQEGNVTGKKKGFTTITVTTEDGGRKADCIVTVINVPLVKIALPVSANVEKGKTTKLEVTFTPSNASNKNLTWTVSDTNIATVANGTVTGVSAGSTVVTARSEDGDHTSSCTVTVTEPAPEPTPTPTPVPGVTTYTVVFKDGDTVVDTQLVQDGQPAKIPALTPAKEGFSFLGWANGNKLWDFNQPVRFNLTLIAKYVSTSPEAVSKNSGSGSDPVPEIQNDTIYLVKGQTYTAGGSGWSLSEGTGIAKVAAKTGNISAQKKGKAVVTNGTLKYTVIVAEPAFESSAKKIPLLVGTTESVKDKFKINSFDSDSDSKYPITWSSANPKIAVVNDGVITGMAKGNVIIYACVGGKQYTSKVTVTDTYKAPAKQTERTISFNMNPLQTITLKYDTNVFKVKGAVWSGDGLEATSNNKGNPDGGFKNDRISITKAGKIKAIGKGSTTITGKDAQNREVQVTITVHAVSSKENTYITKGKRETVKFAFVKNSKAAWDSSDKSIISDFKNGSIKGASVGSSKISCTYEGFEFNTLAYVEDPEFNTDNKLVKNGTKYTMTLNAGELYNRVTLKNVYQTVNFKSSKPAVAFIDENGVIYARNAGKTNITTSINGKTIKISLIVK